MRQLFDWCAVAIILPLSSFSPLTTATYLPSGPQQLSSLSPPTFHQQPSRTRSVFSRLRDGLIRTIWSVPCTRAGQPIQAKPISSTAPTTLLARYGGDVVLRFNVTTPDEAAALADAVNVLFLDVWESNADWVDIRLAKDVVSFSHMPCLHIPRVLRSVRVVRWAD